MHMHIATRAYTYISQRSSTMSVFRSLLNLLVIGVLLLVGLYKSVEPYLVSGAIASMAGID